MRLSIVIPTPNEGAALPATLASRQPPRRAGHGIIVADYRAAFGEEPPPIIGIALMTDAATSWASAEGWYRDIELSPRRRCGYGRVTPTVSISPAAP